MAQFVPPGLSGALGITGGAPPSWESRLREAAYTSPSGTRIRFDYEDVSRSFNVRATAFDFPGVSESYVQQNGHSSRRYPLRCFFWGAEHDRIATAFEAALLERGIGRLEHPLYGTVNVVPFGDVTRRDDLKSAANQTVLEVTFWTTLPFVYPNSTTDAQTEILDAIEGFDVAAAQRFAEVMSVQNAVAQADLKATIRKFLRDVSAEIQEISDSVLAINREFRDYVSLINNGLDVLIGQPLLLAQQVANLIKAPARAAAGIASRLEAYGRLAQSIFGSDAGNPGGLFASGLVEAARATRIANGLHTADLFAAQAVAGSVVATVADPIADAEPGTGSVATTTISPGASAALFGVRPQTRADVIAAAATIIEQWEAFVAWRDEGFRVLAALPQGASRIDPLGTARVDTGETIQALQRAVSLAVGRLVQIAFARAPERRIVLDRARTIVDLCAELYGRVDDRLDFLIATNDLTGDEIIELPRGRSVLYYPEA